MREGFVAFAFLVIASVGGLRLLHQRQDAPDYQWLNGSTGINTSSWSYTTSRLHRVPRTISIETLETGSTFIRFAGFEDFQPPLGDTICTLTRPDSSDGELLGWIRTCVNRRDLNAHLDSDPEAPQVVRVN